MTGTIIELALPNNLIYRTLVFLPNVARLVSTYILYLNTELKINTVEHGLVRGLAIATVSETETRELAKDYAKISEGDEIIGCNNEGIRWRAMIDEVVMATDDEEDSPSKGAAVKIIKGKLLARGNRSIAATVKRMNDKGIAVPEIFNPRGSGFKQGALARLLTEEQEAELDTGLS